MINRDSPSPSDDAPLLINEVVRAGATRLAAAGAPSPRVDAELLLAAALGVPRGRLAVLDEVPPAAAATFDEYVARRRAREPLQHILGTVAFRHVELAVGPGVFVPRPETELLVDAVLSGLAAGGVAVDLCAGSGALALALAHEVPGLRVVAVENDPDALRWLLRNTARTPVRVEHADVTAGPVLGSLAGRVDAVVCNPPYVPASCEVAPEVDADPVGAVFAGPDGLEVIPHVIDRAAELLRRGGTFVLEHDETQGDAVPGLLRAGPWTDVADHRDLAGRPRYATATRR